MTKSFYSHLLTMTMIHGFLFFGTWQIIKSEEVQSLLPKFDSSVIRMKLASSPTIVTPAPKNVVKTEAPSTPKVRPVQETVTPVVTEAVSSGPTSPSVNVMDIYKAELRATIDKNKYYPTMSRRLGQTGTVVIAFTLLEDGNIVDIRIEKPSQYERLNVSALDAVKKVERFKPIPKEAGEIRMDIKVPVKFVTI